MCWKWKQTRSFSFKVEQRMNVRIALRNEGEIPVFVSIYTPTYSIVLPYHGSDNLSFTDFRAHFTQFRFEAWFKGSWINCSLLLDDACLKLTLTESKFKVIYTLDENLTNCLETVKGFRGFTCMCTLSSHKWHTPKRLNLENK